MNVLFAHDHKFSLDEKGKVLVKGHSLRPEEILTALNIDFEVEEVEEM